MTREEATNLALSKIDNTKCLVLQLPTGAGKSRIAIECANKICDRVFYNEEQPTSILILVAKKAHKGVWKEELNKWGIKTDYITIECYASLHKSKGAYFDVCILDEGHHLSEIRQDLLKTLHINELMIVLSATLKKEQCWYFKSIYNAEFIKCDIKEAIEDDVLPEPTIYLMPLKLDNTKYKYRYKKFKAEVIGTQQAYYNNLCNMVDFYKNKYMRTRSDLIKNLWMRTCTERLKWLSEQKEDIILSLLDKFKYCRTLTLCSSIEQTEKLGKYCINSKNKKALEYLDMFNNKKIKHITSCNILNESVNLKDCRIGIFCNINASEIIVKQRVGRTLRHKKPIIIVPYFQQTRAEELINKITENFNEDKIITIHNISEIKL